MDFLGGSGGEADETLEGGRRTVCIAAGNDFKGKAAKCVLIDLNEPDKAVRFSA